MSSRDPRLLALTCLGLGRLRPAPGTWGSLPPAALAWGMLLASAPGALYVAVLAIVAALASWGCLAWTALGERAFGRKDARAIVLDEVAGQAVALLPVHGALLPVGAMTLTGVMWLDAGLAVAAAFVLFRVFDILKPPPANTIQRLPAGAGVLLDDLVAGIYTAVALAAGAWSVASLG